MSGLQNAQPERDQHELLVAHGFSEAFSGLWVERDDLDEVAELLRLDPRSRRDLTLSEEATTMTDPSIYLNERNSVWIGPHSPGWSVVISALEPRTAGWWLSSGDRHYFKVSWLWEIDGLCDLVYFHDGNPLAKIPAFPSGELLPDPVFEPFAHGLPREGDESRGEEWLAHAFLTVVGRMTGRFIDEEWFLTPGRVYDHPPIDTQG